LSSGVRDTQLGPNARTSAGNAAVSHRRERSWPVVVAPCRTGRPGDRRLRPPGSRRLKHRKHLQIAVHDRPERDHAEGGRRCGCTSRRRRCLRADQQFPTRQTVIRAVAMLAQKRTLPEQEKGGVPGRRQADDAVSRPPSPTKQAVKNRSVTS
jgi:hypothetical protein